MVIPTENVHQTNMRGHSYFYTPKGICLNDHIIVQSKASDFRQKICISISLYRQNLKPPQSPEKSLLV